MAINLFGLSATDKRRGIVRQREKRNRVSGSAGTHLFLGLFVDIFRILRRLWQVLDLGADLSLAVRFIVIV